MAQVQEIVVLTDEEVTELVLESLSDSIKRIYNIIDNSIVSEDTEYNLECLERTFWYYAGQTYDEYLEEKNS